jgi:hypothetical protein
MELESLGLDKFKDVSLKREQLFMLNGDGIRSDPGNICAPHGPSQKLMNFNYGYDSQRDGVTTFHNRTEIQDICDNGYVTSDDLDSGSLLRPIL